MALNYLLDPMFQIENSAGKPATDGWLEVYIHGTRTKYYCASDFNGTLHPFKIPLDSLGSNIVLAEDNQTYDVYAYNRFGSLLMSRYNVTPGNGTGGNGPQWVKCIEGTVIQGLVRPTYSEGNIDVGERGIILERGGIYHLTARFGLVNSGPSAYYGNLVAYAKVVNGDDVTTVGQFSFVGDGSFGFTEKVEGSLDFKAPEGELCIELGNNDGGVSIVFESLDLHRVSGAAGGGGGGEQVQSDWSETDPSDPSYIKNKPEIPEVKQLVAGDNVVLTEGDSTITISSYGGDAHPYLSLERLRKYLYRVTFDSLVDDNGNEDNGVQGGCSSYVRDGKLYRNLDWSYDNTASFIVRCKDFVGMSFLTGLDDGEMDDAKIAQLPYRVVDGCNNHKIRVSTHVIINDWQWTSAGGNDSVTLTRLPYLVLTRVKSMETLSADLSGVLNNLYSSEAMQASGYLIQVLVTDGYTTCVLQPPSADRRAYTIVDITSNPKLTNCLWNSNSTIDRSMYIGVEDHPTGIERFNLMPCALEDLKFTLCYESDSRLSEFIGMGGTTAASTDAELTVQYNIARNAYLNRTRDGVTWQTMHSVVYDESGMEHLWIQENWVDDICANKEYKVQSRNGSVYIMNWVDRETSENVFDIDASRLDKAYIIHEYDFFDHREDVDAAIAQRKAVLMWGDWSGEAFMYRLSYVEKQDGGKKVYWFTGIAPKSNGDHVYEPVWNLRTVEAVWDPAVGYVEQYGTAFRIRTEGLKYFDSNEEKWADQVWYDNDRNLFIAYNNQRMHQDPLGLVAPYLETAPETNKVLTIRANSTVPQWVDASSTSQVQADWAESDTSAASFIQNKPVLADVATSGSYNDLSDKPVIPPAVTVDQHYSALSTNAQSGTAVAEALASVPASAQSDWTESDPSDPSYIQNKPTLATVATSGSYNDLSDKPAIPAAQVQSDWNQTNSSAVDYIKNKPTIPPGVTVDQHYSSSSANAQSGTAVAEAIAAVPAQAQSDWSESDTTSASFIQNKPRLANVAISGEYSDLRNTPTIPAAQVQSDWNQTNSSAVDYIKNKPTIPPGVTVDQHYSSSSANAQSGTAVAEAIASVPAQIQSDWNVTNPTSVNFIKNKPTIPAAQVQSDWNQTDNTAVDYIKNKPVIPPGVTVDQHYSSSSTNAQSGTAVAEAIATVPAQVQSDWDQTDSTAVDYIKNKPIVPLQNSKQLVAGDNITLTVSGNLVSVSTLLPGVTVGTINL